VIRYVAIPSQSLGVPPFADSVTLRWEVVESRQMNANCDGRALDSAFPRDSSIAPRHLRRFARWEMLPTHLQSVLQNTSQPTLHVLVTPPLPDISALQTVLLPFIPVQATSEQDINADALAEPTKASQVRIHSTQIPLQPPLSPQQAERWSRTMWPVTYNPAAPRSFVAPPPQVLNLARQSIAQHVGFYLSLAREVAAEARNFRRGRGVGAVVVDPGLVTGEGWVSGIVAVAGDARYCNDRGSDPGSAVTTSVNDSNFQGRPDLHAIMRVVAMIASRRRADDHTEKSACLRSASAPSAHIPPLSSFESYFLYTLPTVVTGDQNQVGPGVSSLVSMEEWSIQRPGGYRIRTRSQGGYLCTGLDIYITHEPCLSCSMGMLLSRFRAIVFPRRGRMVTGGLATEPRQGLVKGSSAETGTCRGRKDSPTTSVSPRFEKDEAVSESAACREPTDEERNYYGLHWRTELNWRTLGFEFVEEDSVEDEQEMVDMAFHA
jgi:tRNA-specific adenosine deaminase 3